MWEDLSSPNQQKPAWLAHSTRNYEARTGADISVLQRFDGKITRHVLENFLVTRVKLRRFLV